MTTAIAVGAVSREAAEWHAINWPTIHHNVRRLQVLRRLLGTIRPGSSDVVQARNGI